MTDIPKKPRGFACLTPERRREIAAMGGASVPKEKRAYFIDNELARASGRKGGISVPPEKRTYSQDRELASRAGVAGGNALHHSRGGHPARGPFEMWSGRHIAKLIRLANAGKSLVECREEIGSDLKIPAFREKARALGITFVRTRSK